MSAPIHSLATNTLALQPGEVVLDIGCGDGAYFPTIRDQIGDMGRIVGVDYSHNLLERAAARIAEHRWDNVEIHEEDFTRTRLAPGEYDAALAIFALSAMTDVQAAVDAAYTALRPGGRMFVIDLRLVPHGAAAPLILLCRWAYWAIAGGSGVDVLDAARRTFDRVELVDTGRGTDVPRGFVTAIKGTKARRGSRGTA